MRNGGIGRGWHPEKDIEVDKVKVLAEHMLKEELKFVFDIIQEKHYAAHTFKK